MHSEARIKKLRVAALLAGLAQIWPCYVALQTHFIRPPIVMDDKMLGSLWGGINVFVACAVFAFYVAVLSSSVPLRVPPGLNNVALFTAVMIGLQNAHMTLGNLQAVFARSRNTFQWQHHPIGQLWYVLQPLIPTAWVVFTILFLVTASKLPRRQDQGVQSTVKRRASIVAVVALVACAAAAAELIAMLYMNVCFFHLLTVPFFLQVAIDGSFLMFFVLMYKAKASCIQQDRAWI